MLPPDVALDGTAILFGGANSFTGAADSDDDP